MWGGGVTPLYKPYTMLVYAAPLGRVFVPFLSEVGYTLCPFWSGIEYGFQGNYGVYECIYRFKIQMIKKERQNCEFEMNLNFFFVCTLV